MNTPNYTWYVSSGPALFLDFCFWVLERDGLRIPPFDRHADGDGSLRAAGMTPDTWRTWLGRVDAAVREFNTRMSGDDWPPWPEPAALWDGAPAGGARLTALATEYDDLFNERKEASIHLWWPDQPNQEPSWEALAQFDQLLPPLRVAYVAYPGPARLVIPPATVVLAAVGWHPAPGELTAAVVAGATELVVSPG
jgi:hypothetical protein